MSGAIITPESRKKLHEFIDTMFDNPQTTGCLIQCAFLQGEKVKHLSVMKGGMSDAAIIATLIQGMQKMLSNVTTSKAFMIRALMLEVQKALDDMVAKDLEAASTAAKINAARGSIWN